MKILAPEKSSVALHRLVVVALAGWLMPSQMLATLRYVDVNSASPAPPYTNWATAAVTIQQAVDAAALLAGPSSLIAVANHTSAPLDHSMEK